MSRLTVWKGYSVPRDFSWIKNYKLYICNVIIQQNTTLAMLLSQRTPPQMLAGVPYLILFAFKAHTKILWQHWKLVTIRIFWPESYWNAISISASKSCLVIFTKPKKFLGDIDYLQRSSLFSLGITASFS